MKNVYIKHLQGAQAENRHNIYKREWVATYIC